MAVTTKKITTVDTATTFDDVFVNTDGTLRQVPKADFQQASGITDLNSRTIPWTSYEGQLEVTIDDTSFSGISTFAKSLINGNVGKKWITVRVNSSTSAPKVEPFYGASFGLTINCSSTNYGWGWLQSDNEQNQVYYGRLSAGTWTWYKVGKQDDIDANTAAIGALNSRIGAIKKETTTTDGSVTFTFTGNRYTAILMIQSNTFSGSGIYGLIFKKGAGSSIKSLAGNEGLPTIDSNGSITFNMVSWSKAILYTTSGDEFS